MPAVKDAAKVEKLSISNATEETLRKLGVNSFRSVLGGKANGTPVKFVSTGEYKINRSEYKNSDNENIVSAYIMGQGGYRLKLNAGFNAADYSAGKIISCVVTADEIDGVLRRWLSTVD